MKNILKNSPVLKRVHIDNKFYTTLLARHPNQIGKLYKKSMLFSKNIFDNVVFLQKYHRRKKNNLKKLNRYLNVPSVMVMLDLSVDINKGLVNKRVETFGFKQLKKKELKEREDYSKVDNQKNTVNGIAKAKNFLESEALAPKISRLKPSILSISNSLLTPTKFKKNQELKYQKELIKLKEDVKNTTSKSLNQSILKNLIEKQKAFKLENKFKEQKKITEERLVSFGFKQLKKKELKEKLKEREHYSKSEVDNQENAVNEIAKAKNFLELEALAPKIARLNPSIPSISNSLLTPTKFKKNQELKYQKELVKNTTAKSLNQSILKNIIEKKKTFKRNNKFKEQKKIIEERLVSFGFKQLKKKELKEREDYSKVDNEENAVNEIAKAKNFLESETLSPKTVRIKPSISNVSNSLLVPTKFKNNQELKYQKELVKLKEEAKNSTSKSLNQSILKNLIEKQKAFKSEDKFKEQKKITEERLVSFGFKQLKKKELKEKLKEHSAFDIKNAVELKTLTLEPQKVDSAFLKVSNILTPKIAKLNPSILSISNSLLTPTKFKKNQALKYQKELTRLKEEAKNATSKSLNQSLLKNIIEKQKAFKVENKFKEQKKITEERLVSFGFKQLKKKELKEKLKKEEIKEHSTFDIKNAVELKTLTLEPKRVDSAILKVSNILTPKIVRLNPSIPSISNSLLTPIKFKKNQELKYQKELKNATAKSLNQSVLKNIIEKQKAFKEDNKLKEQKKITEERLVSFGFKQLKKKKSKENLKEREHYSKSEVDNQENAVNEIAKAKIFLESEALVSKIARLKSSIPSISNSLLTPTKFKKNQEVKYQKELVKLKEEAKNATSKSLNQSVLKNIIEKQKAFKEDNKLKEQKKITEERLVSFGFKQLKKKELKEKLENEEIKEHSRFDIKNVVELKKLTLKPLKRIKVDSPFLKVSKAQVSPLQVKNQFKNYNNFLINREFLNLGSNENIPPFEDFIPEDSLVNFETIQKSSSIYVDFIKKANLLDRRIENLQNKVFKSGGGFKEQQLNGSNNLSMNLAQASQPLAKEEVKYAKEDRHETVSSKSVKDTVEKELSSSKGSFDDLDELSMKMFQRLKNDIALEYTRAGR